MLMRSFGAVFRWFSLGLVAMGLLALPRTFLSWHYQDRIHSLEAPPLVDGPTAAVVFGAGLRHDGGPTRVLADRVASAVYLYEQGVVQKLVLSGTVRDGYDEPAAMLRYARALGVPETDLHVDPDGTRTIETCRNVKRLGVPSVILVTQRYHLPRALATCDGLGLPAYGVAADLRRYRSELVWTLREFPATLVALYETYLHPQRGDERAWRSEVVARHGS